MSDEKKFTVAQQQAIDKPKPEDIAGELLNPERAANFLNLVEFIRANKIGIRWASWSNWQCNFKGQRLGNIRIAGDYPVPSFKGTWYFSHNHLYLDTYYSMDESDLKTFAFDNIFAKTCGNCMGTSTDPNEQKAGYMNPDTCTCYPLRIYNPSGKRLESTKQLIEYRMNCILGDLNNEKMVVD